MSEPLTESQAFRRTLSWAVRLPVLLTVGLAVVLLGQVFYLLSSARWVDHTDEAIGRGFRLQKLLTDAQASYRGYLITGDAEFLGPYEAAERDVEAAVRSLASFVSDNPAQMRLAETAGANWGEWHDYSRRVRARRDAGEDYASIVASKQGKRLMDRVRADLDAFIAEEERLRARRVRHVKVATAAVVASALGLAMGFGGYLAGWTRRTLLGVSKTYSGALDEAKQRSQALAESERLNRLLIASVQDYAIILLDRDGKVASWNEGARRTHGYAADEVIGRPVALLCQEDRAGEVDGHLRLATERGSFEFEGWQRRKDGSRFWGTTTLTALRDDVNQLHGFSKVTRDITARKRMEEALRESEERLRAILNTAPDAILTTSADGTIEGLNPAAEEVFGYAQAELVGRNVSELLAADGGGTGGNGAHAKVWGPAEVATEATGRRRDGRTFPAELSTASFVRDGRERITGIVRDVTERRQWEEEKDRLNRELEHRVEQRTLDLRHAIEDLDAFALTVSHDLRAPLRNLQEFAKALLEEYGEKLEGDGADYARRIVAGAARVDRLVQDVLEYSRVARSQVRMERLNLALIVNQVISQVRQESAGATAEYYVREPMPPVVGHRTTLVQVLYSLLDNAVKFVGPGVRPTVSIYSEDVGDCVRMWVEDNGIGVEPEHREEIFRPFERLHGMQAYRGSGLGLAIVRRGMDKMGGRAGVEPGLGGAGSRFWIELPKSADVPCTTPPPVADAAASSSSSKTTRMTSS